MFLTFVVFACFATTRVNMRFRAKNTPDSAQGYIQCTNCIGNPVVRTDGQAISRQKHTGFSTGLYPVYELYW